jgi:DNA-binding MarR family transcriptional regulator
VGFDYDRILNPIQDSPPNKLYLFFDSKRDEYGKLSKKFAIQIEKAVGKIIKTELIGFNPWDFKDAFEKIMKIFLKEKSAEITINISSSTNLAVAAAIYAASIFRARIVYVRGEYKELPTVRNKVSAARDSPQFIDPFTPTELTKDELKILHALYRAGGEIESLTQLTSILISYKSKTRMKDLRKNRALLSYKVKKLEELGFVRRSFSNKRNRVSVKLTDAGEVMGKLASSKSTR